MPDLLCAPNPTSQGYVYSLPFFPTPVTCASGSKLPPHGACFSWSPFEACPLFPCSSFFRSPFGTNSLSPLTPQATYFLLPCSPQGILPSIVMIIFLAIVPMLISIMVSSGGHWQNVLHVGVLLCGGAYRDEFV